MRQEKRTARPGTGRGCWILLAVFAGVFLVSVFHLASCLREDRQAERYNESMRELAVSPRGMSSAGELPPIEVDFEKLQEECPDIVAWIYCPGTEVNYPVLRAEDNDYYLRRLSDGSYHIAGSIFADFRCAEDLSDENVILYGHNMRNGSMFALLPQYAEQKFYEAHPVWYLLTPTADYKVYLFAGFVTSTRSLVYSTGREVLEDGRTIMDKAWEDSNFRGVDAPKEGERTLTLSTCSYDFSGARYVLLGILRELGEET